MGVRLEFLLKEFASTTLPIAINLKGDIWPHVTMP